MQLSIAPKAMARKQALMQPALETESAVSLAEEKGNSSSIYPSPIYPSSIYPLAVIVRISVVGAILFQAMTLWPW